VLSAISNGQSVKVFVNQMTINNENSTSELKFQNSLESAFSNLERAPKLVERDNLSSLIEFLQNEENLRADFNVSKVEEFNPEHIDYIIYSNLRSSPLNNDVYIQIECVKVFGDSMLSKFSFPSLKLKVNELNDLTLFEMRLTKFLNQYAFVDKLGVIEYSILEEINSKIDEKTLEIKNLRNEIYGITEYIDVAQMNILGEKLYRIGSGISWDDPLYLLMKEVVEETSSLKIGIKTDEKSLDIINRVIIEYPRFPFGYYCKAVILAKHKNPDWVIYAKKAQGIFKFTTQIKGANNMHNQCFEELSALLDKY
jgi:hypothetical protein